MAYEADLSDPDSHLGWSVVVMGMRLVARGQGRPGMGADDDLAVDQDVIGRADRRQRLLWTAHRSSAGLTGNMPPHLGGEIGSDSVPGRGPDHYVGT